MAPRVISSRSLKRRTRTLREYFYPGEVARILELKGLDYHQLRRIFRLIYATEPAEQESREGGQAWSWARFTFRDLVAIRTVVSLAGGVDALNAGKRLRLGQVEAVCRSLRKEFGLNDPLRQVALARVDNKVIARVQGVWLEPISGQLLLDEVAQVAKAVDRYIERESQFTVELKALIQKTVDKEEEQIRNATDPFALVFALAVSG